MSEIPYSVRSSRSSAAVSGGSYTKDSVLGPITNSKISGFWTTVVATTDITNNNNGTFTVNTPGNYLINFCVRFSNTTGAIYDSYVYLERIRGGTTTITTDTVLIDQAPGGGDFFRFLSITSNYFEPYQAGDIIQLRAQSNPAVNIEGVSAGTSRTWINIIKIS